MTFEAAAEAEAISIEVELRTAAKVNFASSQNGVSIIKSLVIRNISPEVLENVVVELECSPGLIRPKSWTLDRLSAEDRRSLTDLDTPLNMELLGGLNEAEVGELRLAVRQADRVLVREARTIEMLARDEWGGVGEMAQLLAAFVSPNDPVVAAILKDAGALLERTGQSGSIDGYQAKDPARVWMLAGAIWSAVTALGLTYAVPPASFELRGQKVRDPGRIRSEGLATCLDSSLLLAACFEAAGLNPVVLFSEGHAWTGVWLTNRDFGTVSEPDVMTVRKAVDAREFVMMETTLLTRRPTVGFEEAVVKGREHTAERNEHSFLLAVDVRRARVARVRPLASHRLSDMVGSADIPASPAALPRPLDLGLLPGDLIEEEPSTASDRISRWQRKLLDLSLRNRLLNFKDSKQTLPFICPDVSALEDQLAQGKKFRALPLKEEDPIGQRDLLVKEAPAILQEVARDAFAKGQISVPLTRKEAERRLLELHRRAKSDLQEGGTNTLFLAAGFLRWKKSEGDTRSYRAPLILLPVKISRRSAQSDFVIEHHEDDVRINSTLLEFLKRDFDLKIPELEGELPRDESGHDLPRIFEIMRRKVRDVAGFEVVEEVALSTFSFAKFLMWKDLVDRTDSLRASPLVAHLVDNPAEPFLKEGAPGLPVAVDVDRRIAPRDLFAPLPADSSQLAAVLAAQEGHDFVLIGPPGTGKSQTIANIISQCLAVGKTVLFVAEKAAALDVVHRRLAAHGLGDAVLELHSNKADRKSVLDQLGRSWARASAASQEEWIKVTDDLEVTREQLNAYVGALHRKGSQGFSVFEAIGRAGGDPLSFSLTFDNKDAHDAESYAHLARLSEALGRCHEIVAGRKPLRLVEAGEWSFGWQAELLGRTDRLKAATRALKEAAEQLASLAGFDAAVSGTPESLRTLNSFAEISAHGADVSWAFSRDLEQLRRDANDLAAKLKGYSEAAAAPAASYPMDRLHSIPLEQLDSSWRLAKTKMWPFSVFAKSSVRKLMQTYATGGHADPERDIAALIDAKHMRDSVEAHPLKDCPLYRGVETDGSALAAWLGEAAALRQSLDKLAPAVVDASAWEKSVQTLASRASGDLREGMTKFKARMEAWSELLQAFQDASGSLATDLHLDALGDALNDILAQKDQLSDWTRWMAAKHQALGAGLAPLVEAVEAELPLPADAAFRRAYAAWWLPLAMDAEPALRSFAHWSHEDAIARFRALDARATEMAAEQVLNRVQHSLPGRDMVSRSSELGILRHQVGLQRPSMPIRTLISEMPQTFTKLAPCVLMSPLSVAQYLPAGQAAFDVVIFDEASQITTWDAIGAIARGKQAIIVGDPKQLPPTNFFGRADGGEEDLPEIERDMPSILDEVAAAGIPTQQLNWHYRSRDESLIAFSNWHYYGGRLVTFPSPATSSEAVQLHQVDGVYGRGQGRTNEIEARAIVEMALRRLNEWLKWPVEDRLTLGVITFNAEQQGLILDLLDEERRRNPELEWFFEDAREEPVIVKNLENIQGDERDVMLFSITFGPDPAGKLSMAFGALNGDGGEKRLNVAVTRARQELHVFASIRADQIDLTRTQAMGVKHLKGFLDFAARGAIALPAQDEGSLGPVENIFEASVKAGLEAKGWELRPQIGVSGFRIDLAVVHPEHGGVYLAGIECDGATYHSSATARDRDKVRQAVLENLGWTIFRIWSTDWFRNPKAVIDRVDAALRAHLDKSRQSRNEGDPRAASSGSGDILASDSDSDSENIIPRVLVDLPSTPVVAPDSPQDVSEEETSRQEPMVAGQGSDVYVSKAAPLGEQGTPKPDPDRFYEPNYHGTLEKLIADLVCREGPMPLSLVGRRISAMHGWQRTGRRIADQVRASLRGVELQKEDDVEFVWAKGSFAKRLGFRHGLDRSLRDISRSEIAGLYDTHAHAFERSEDPVLELARLAGINRLSSDAREYLQGCIRWRTDTVAPD